MTIVVLQLWFTTPNIISIIHRTTNRARLVSSMTSGRVSLVSRYSPRATTVTFRNNER